MCSHGRGCDAAVGRPRGRLGAGELPVPGIQEAIGKFLCEFSFRSNGELYDSLFEFSAEGLEHPQLGVVLLHALVHESIG